jgi:UDP-hydrolysing UDP-N-acetyl-D-glucosamine 2-epimerase
MLVPGDDARSISRSIGKGVAGFAGVYGRLKPDLIVALGDRFEVFAAVCAAVPFKIPVAHIHGGETTLGAFDDKLRHAITKMSSVHFTSAEEYRKKVISMGENPSKVFCFGAPGLDNIHRLGLSPEGAVRAMLKIPAGMKIGVLAFHPATLERMSPEEQVSGLLSAAGKSGGLFWVITGSNADTGGKAVDSALKKFALSRKGKAVFVRSLGSEAFLSLLKCASVIAGNSSSAIIEAPSFRLPAVNIGRRQEGRLRAPNVIDVPGYGEEEISRAIKKALSAGFKRSIARITNPYGNGDASRLIVRALKGMKL